MRLRAFALTLALAARAQAAPDVATWRSLHPDGTTMAEGRYVANRQEGAWRFYHPSGNLAAEGRFERGVRSGAWRFYYDVRPLTPIAEGSFKDGAVTGEWRHYDARGKLLALSRDVTPASWVDSRGGHLLDVLPGADGVHRWVHQGVVGEDHYRLELITDGSEPLYVNEFREIFDADGHKLAREDGRWMIASDCHWTRARKSAAHAYDLVTVHGLGWAVRWTDDQRCDVVGRPLDDARASHVEIMARSLERVRERSPAFVEKLALGDPPPDEDDGCAHDTFVMARDLAEVLASFMVEDVKWPHVDGLFAEVSKTLPRSTPP